MEQKIVQSTVFFLVFCFVFFLERENSKKERDTTQTKENKIFKFLILFNSSQLFFILCEYFFHFTSLVVDILEELPDWMLPKPRKHPYNLKFN